jgi:hypothetical protein
MTVDSWTKSIIGLEVILDPAGGSGNIYVGIKEV